MWQLCLPFLSQEPHSSWGKKMRPSPSRHAAQRPEDGDSRAHLSQRLDELAATFPISGPGSGSYGTG